MNDHLSYPGLESLMYGRAWAILPEKLAVMESFLQGWRAGARLTAEEIEQRIGAVERRSTSVAKGVAVIPVYGVLSQRMNLLSAFSGGTSTELLSKQFREALSNPDVGTIVLDVDSPGGAVSGIPELASEIFQARGQKKTVAVSNTLMASAAYWLASQADEIVVSPSSATGSIGVYTMHVDYSQQNAMVGANPTYISAGKYKVEANPDQPLTDEALTYLQSQVNEYYKMFTDAVAQGRDVKRAEVLNGFGEGRVATAQQAVEQGMADRVGTLSQVLEKLGVGSQGKKTNFALEKQRLELRKH